MKLLMTYRPKEKRDFSVFIPILIRANQQSVIPLLIEHGVKFNAKHIKLAQDCGHEELEKMLTDAVQNQERQSNRFRWFPPRNVAAPAQEAAAAPALG